MKKQELATGIVHYVFDAEPGKYFASSVTAIVSGNKAILIDAAYDFQIPKILEDLTSNHIEIENIIITHFHDDHMQGLKVLPKVPVYGSRYFQDTLDKWTKKEEHIFFTPSFVVYEPLTLSFGEHTLTLIPFPGHSLCGLLVNIDNKFIHIADELMFSPDGVPLLPISDGKDMQRHIDSLHRLENYGDFTLIPSHGSVFSAENLDDEIKNRITYLNAVLESKGTINYEDATKDCTCTFLHSEWHRGNCVSI